MTDDRHARYRDLCHDVGKYVARTARNVSGVESVDPLHAMLCADLFGGPTVPRPSQRFAALREGLDDPTLDEVGAWLARIDALERAVRARDARAVAEAVALARRVETTLRALLSEASR